MPDANALAVLTSSQLRKVFVDAEKEKKATPLSPPVTTNQDCVKLSALVFGTEDVVPINIAVFGAKPILVIEMWCPRKRRTEKITSGSPSCKRKSSHEYLDSAG